MARNQTRSLPPKTIVTDRQSLTGINGIKGYKPAKSDFALKKLNDAEKALAKAEKAMLAAEAASKKARDEVVNRQWGFHNLMIGARQQVVAQFGDSSDEAQSIGLKKRTERKSPKKKAAKAKPA